MFEQKYSGIKASAGIAIGKALLYRQREFRLPDHKIDRIAVNASWNACARDLKWRLSN